MAAKAKTRIVECPIQQRLVEVTYGLIGKWYNRDYDVQSCPVMHEAAGCYRQCKSQLTRSRSAREWSARY